MEAIWGRERVVRNVTFILKVESVLRVER